MEDFLDEIIEESSYSSYERAIEPVGKSDYLKDEYFSKREVLVGALKSKDQLEVNLKYNFYHIPQKKINLAKNNIKYVALSQSQNLFGSDGGIVWYGKIKGIHLVKRNEILELPKDDESLYYRLEIEKWFKLETKIEISKYQVRSFIYTTFYHKDDIRNKIKENILAVEQGEYCPYCEKNSDEYLKANYTIDILNLNSYELREARKALIDILEVYRENYEEYNEYLQFFLNDGHNFPSLIKLYIEL